MAKRRQELQDFTENNPAIHPTLREYFKYLNDTVVTWPETTTTTTTTSTTTTT